MSIQLDDYIRCLPKELPEHETKGIFESSYLEASRVMSPAGLERYVEGAKALCMLGRGADPVLTYLQEMPAVAKELGDDILTECLSSTMRLASLVSGAVISDLLGSLPTAARRLGDPELMVGYLNLIHQLASKAPRGLRPMFRHIDDLLAKLTLGGLRRWALWGAQAHARDFEAQIKYFGLQSADSEAVFQRERRGTLFIDNQRKLNFYLRALWGRDFFLRPTAGDFEAKEGHRPYVERNVIHLPDAYDDYRGIPGVDIYRAAAAHAASHVSYTNAALSAEALNPVQMFLIGLFEDARIEYQASQEFPGLQKLWLRFYTALASAEETEPEHHPMVDLLVRLAHTLLDAQHQDPHPVVKMMAERFYQRAFQEADNHQMSWDLGVELYNRLKQEVAIPSLRILEQFPIPYRDDNRFIWEFDEQLWEEIEYIAASQRQVRKTVNLMEMVNELDTELAGDDAQEIWTLETEFFRDGDPEGVSLNRLEGKEPVSEPYHYQEWDYHVQLYRPDWVTVLERRPHKGDAESIDNLLIEHKPLASRIRHIIDALQPQGIIRRRHQEDGDEIDINAAIRAMIDIRRGETPDPRINTRYIRNERDLAVLVLLDLSESTNETVPGMEQTILGLAREATGLLAWAINGIGDPFAVHGFASDGRHDVQYYRFKNFDEEYGEQAKARLAGMRGALSTRMGGALRHAGRYLMQRPQQKKLLLMVSDGEPADIDERDPQYLRHDTKKAVEELALSGIYTYCLTLDPQADSYVSRLFGPNHYSILDNVRRLPERLPALFAGLTGR